MIYLVLAVLTSALISVIMRYSEKRCKNKLTMLAVNYLTCGIFGAAYTGSTDLFPAIEGLGQTLGLGLIGGFLFLTSFMLMQYNIGKNGVLLPTTFMKLGIIIPTLMSVLVFGEQPRIVQILGILLAIFAIIIMNGGGKNEVGSTASLLLLLVITGCSNAMSKIFEEVGYDAFSNHYLFYIFTTAFIMCVGVCLVRKQGLTLTDLLWGVCIGIPNYYSARFMLQSLAHIPATVVYPSYSVGSIVLVAIAGVVLFKEKIGKRKLIALGMILVALALLNLK